MTAVIAAIRSETTKIRTLRSVQLCCALLLLLCAGVQALALDLSVDAVAGIDADGTIELFAGSRVPAEEGVGELLVTGMFVAVPLLPVVGALAAGSEFPTGQIGTSVVATPSRVRLLAAQATAAALLALAVCVAFALLTTALMVPAVVGWRPAVLVSPDVLGGYLRVALVAVCTTLTSLGITVLTRRALVGVLLMALLLGLTVTQLLAGPFPAIDAALPVSAARNLLFHDSLDVVPPLTSGPWTGALVLLAWAALALVAAAAAVERRDAR